MASALAACSGAGGGGPGGPPPAGPSFGEDGGEPAPPVANGATVARLTTESPDLGSYILRGTFPVPPGTFPRSDGLQPFTIHDYDGTPLETQTETVTRYADASRGADVVEVLARVRRDPSLGTGARAEFEVRQSPRPAAPSPGSPGPEDLSRPSNLTPNVTALLADPTAIEIATYDVFGNKYACYPLDGTGWHQLKRHGRVQTELRVYQNMAPVAPVSGSMGTLPHLFGVHAYISTFRGDDLIGLDLRFHNGHSGNDDANAMDDPLDKVYFERIEVTLPDNWLVTQAFADPMFGDESYGGGKHTVALVNSIGNGRMHVMRWQGQMNRRLMLSTAGLASAAGEYVSESAGQAFCVRGFDPAGGHEYWSWWNRGTARYFAQNYQLPSLDHVGLAGLRNADAVKLAVLKGYLENGTSAGKYPVASGNLGWAHPYGVPYGGMTSGEEIFIYDGVRTASSGSPAGVQSFKAYHRMHTDRMPTAFYDLDGQPTSVESWLVGDRYVPFQHYNYPNRSSGDPFGLGDAPQFQIAHVTGTGKAASYEAALQEFDAHDYQHYIRYTRSPKVLLWLANDSLSRDDLLMQAENFHLAYHTYDNNSTGGIQATGMKADQQYVAGLPASGFQFGRGEAWGIDCNLAAYAAGDDAYRQKRLPWFRALALLLSEGQGGCNGFIQSNITPKNLGGLYRTRQQIEQSIIESMLQGLRETVFRDAAPSYSMLVRDVLIDSLNGFISDMVFLPGFSVPPAITAIGPLDESAPLWCSFGQMPSGGWSTSREGYQDWCSFAFGYELTGDPEFLRKALGQTLGNGTLFGELMDARVDNIENKAALLALVQRLNGTL